VYLRDLPQGSYTFALRSIDIVGNKSEWSKPVKTIIDRVYPVVTNNFVVSAANTKELTVVWKGATDAGAGICQASVLDEDGLVIQSTSAKNALAFKVSNGTSLTGTAQVFDCAGNGQSGDLNITNNFIAASKFSRTGKWISATPTFGAGSIKCVGKCAASISTSGKFHVLLGAGTATVEVGGKKVASVSQGAANSVFSNKVVRISGSNIILVGLSSVTTTLGALEEIDRTPAIIDSSLLDDKQAKLAKLGFRADDFSQEWIVLPMDGGTKLDDPSLDLCNGTFASEKDRVQRRQVAATKAGSTFSFLSSEVVKYSSVAAATAAQKELVKVLAQCKIDKGHKNATGNLVSYDFKTLKNIPAGVVSDSNRVFVHAVIDSGDGARNLLGFYQFSGDTFTGLYVITADPFTDAQVAKWLNIAVTMAQRLQQK
jgi:hypothetical protein